MAARGSFGLKREGFMATFYPSKMLPCFGGAAVWCQVIREGCDDAQMLAHLPQG